MGRTDQVLTWRVSSSIMKAVLALLLICLIKLSLGEEQENSANDTSSLGNLLLPRITRETGRKCKKGDKVQKCQNKLRKKKKRNGTYRWKVKMTKTKISKKAAKIETRKLNKRKKKQRKQPNKISKKKSKKNRRKVKHSKTKKRKTAKKKKKKKS